MAARGKGSLDGCTQAFCNGWALWDGAPARVEIWRNGELVAAVQCNQPRNDLAALGMPRDAGFSYYFADVLAVEDRLDVRFPDGAALPNSTGDRHRERLGRMLTGIDPARPGLEFGPLSRPLLSRARTGVRFVDYLTREELRAKYRSPDATAQVRPERIPPIDYVWRGQRLRDVAGEGWEYCLASHMIEHSPDPIGYLAQFAEVLVPGGRINLAIPEQTQTFDHLRALSRPADLLEAWARRLERPSFGQIFDHLANAHTPGAPPADLPAQARLAFTTAREAAATGDYVDVHCHVWSHGSFRACWDVIATIGLLPLRLAEIFPPAPVGAEFIVSLVKT